MAGFNFFKIYNFNLLCTCIFISCDICPVILFLLWQQSFAKHGEHRTAKLFNDYRVAIDLMQNSGSDFTAENKNCILFQY